MLGGALVVLLGGFFLWVYASYPSDREPIGAYVRVVEAVLRDRPEEFFAYTEDAAQHSCYTIRDYRKRAMDRVLADFPEKERAAYEAEYGDLARAPDGSDVFGWYARREGWLDQLRRDLSRAERVEIQGERATVVTARGTRYSFRRRQGGIWGLTAFTPTLLAEAERAARDLPLLEKAAEDYQRGR